MEQQQDQNAAQQQEEGVFKWPPLESNPEIFSNYMH